MFSIQRPRKQTNKPTTTKSRTLYNCLYFLFIALQPSHLAFYYDGVIRTHFSPLATIHSRPIKASVQFGNNGSHCEDAAQYSDRSFPSFSLSLFLCLFPFHIITFNSILTCNLVLALFQLDWFQVIRCSIIRFCVFAGHAMIMWKKEKKMFFLQHSIKIISVKRQLHREKKNGRRLDEMARDSIGRNALKWVAKMSRRNEFETVNPNCNADYNGRFNEIIIIVCETR